MTFWKKVLDSLGTTPETRLYEEEARAAEERARQEIEKQTKKAAKPKKPRKPKPKVTKSPKQIATEKGEPYISVISVEVDKTNLSNGNFELDWNDAFIKDLRASGYPGKTDEDVVDMWFRNICRNVLAETFEQEVAQKPAPDNVRYINRTTGPDGKTEVS